MMLIVTSKNLSLLDMLISSWLIMGDYRQSDHIINGTHRLYVLLSLLYNLMFYHGHTAADLLKSTIRSIPNDNKKSLSGSDNYRGISLFN